MFLNKFKCNADYRNGAPKRDSPVQLKAIPIDWLEAPADAEAAAPLKSAESTSFIVSVTSAEVLCKQRGRPKPIMTPYQSELQPIEAVERLEILPSSQPVHEQAHSRALERACVGGVSEVRYRQGDIRWPNSNGFRRGEEACSGRCVAQVIDL